MQDAWSLIRAASDAVRRGGAPVTRAWLTARDDGELEMVAREPGSPLLEWMPGRGWRSPLAADHPDRTLLDLYLPVCSAHEGRPITVGHLGQSLDGFIAVPSGDSHFVNGHENIVHLHRMRALCDAVVVGGRTVVADDPRLTTRLVEGGNPLRVIIDPARRLEPHHRVFTDGEAPTLWICASHLGNEGERPSAQTRVVGIPATERGLDLAALVAHLHREGCARIFVEGGGVTVSRFLEAGLLDRLQLAVAPLIIGEGRPAIRLSPQASLRDCRRLRLRTFEMGNDVLFDCDLGESRAA